MEAATTYVPDATSEVIVDEYLESLTEEELADFWESIEEGRRAYKNGECYDWDEVLRYLDETMEEMRQGRYPGFEEYLAGLREKFGNASLEEMCL